MKEKRDSGKGITRRDWLKRSGGVGAAALSGPAWAGHLGQAGAISALAIKLLLNQRLAPIPAQIFGHLVEHYGRTLDGIWVGANSSIPNDGGLRLDTIKAFQQLRTPLFRYPGGTFADEYRWQDGLGPALSARSRETSSSAARKTTSSAPTSF